MPCLYAKYAYNWLTEIRPLILRRAGALPEKGIEAKCEVCGIENKSSRHWGEEKGYKVTRIVLTIAHLDQNIKNNDPENLKALCQKCHFTWDRPFHLVAASITRDRKKKQLTLPSINEKEWRKDAMVRRLTHSLNVLLSEEELSMLSHLATKTSSNMSVVMRQALRSRFAMEIGGRPTCANGQNCFVPQMHSPQPPQQMQPQPQPQPKPETPADDPEAN